MGNTGFGLAYLRGEGAPLHPDDVNYDWPDKKSYMEQAKLYYDHYGFENEWQEFKKVAEKDQRCQQKKEDVN